MDFMNASKFASATQDPIDKFATSVFMTEASLMQPSANKPNGTFAKSPHVINSGSGPRRGPLALNL